MITQILPAGFHIGDLLQHQEVDSCLKVRMDKGHRVGEKDIYDII